RAGSKTPDLLQKHPPHDELSGSFEGQFTHRLRRDGGCLQGTGQATSWWRRHALDISRRSRRSSTQGCRPNQQPMERILAQNLPVRRGDRSRLYRLIILYIIWESHPHTLALPQMLVQGIYRIEQKCCRFLQPDCVTVRVGSISRPKGDFANKPLGTPVEMHFAP